MAGYMRTAVHHCCRHLLPTPCVGPLQSLRPLSDVTPSRTDNKESILNASLGFVVEHGWSHTALARGATAVGLPAVAHGMFTRGGIELLEHFEQQCNERLVGFLQSKTEQEEPVRGSQMIKAAVERRLRMIIPYINRWPEALAMKAYPPNISSSLNSTAIMVDDMWYYAGDDSTDFNWYSKRAMLAAVYCSTELFMVQDNSVDFHETWQFLRRRLEDIATLSMGSRKFSQVTEGGMGVASTAFTTVLNMMKLNPQHR